MASSLSNLINNFSEGIHKIKYKYGHDNKKCETCGVTYEVSQQTHQRSSTFVNVVSTLIFA